MKVFLSIGTNIGNRLENLRQAVVAIKSVLSNVRTSIVYETKALLPDGGDIAWDMPYYNMAVRGETTLSPQLLLESIKRIEASMGRKAGAKKWAPRVIDIDILLYDNQIINQENLAIPHPEMLKRGFVMLPLSMISGATFHPIANKTIEQLLHEMPKEQLAFIKTISLETRVMGVVNLSHDSFSLDGVTSISMAVNKVMDHVCNGASIIDFGPTSTRPGANISNCIDIDFIYHAMHESSAMIKSKNLSASFSIDTSDLRIIKAIQDVPHLRMINDVSGGSDEIFKVVRDMNLEYVLMHSLSVPPTSCKVLDFCDDIADILLKWLEIKLLDLQKYDISAKSIFFDPGVGFGKSMLQSWQICQNIEKIAAKAKILIGASRKSFFGYISKEEKSALDMHTAILCSVTQADIVRVHNVEAAMKALVTRDLVKAV